MNIQGRLTQAALALAAATLSFGCMNQIPESMPTEVSSQEEAPQERKAKRLESYAMDGAQAPLARAQPGVIDYDAMQAEQYNAINENQFHSVLDNPRSTFSIDVDTASYSNVRRMINQGTLPPRDAVRIEEMINYFPYQYKDPKGQHPFSITTELANNPWNPDNKLVLVGLQGKHLDKAKLPPMNLVFLIDVSGSMHQRLPLVKSSLTMLVNEMREQDTISVVVYAGAAGVVLPPTDGSQKQEIIDTLDSLTAGGSTAGGQGIKLAYKLARQYHQPKSNSRIILVTDGDFNVGAQSQSELLRLIESQRDYGIYLTVLGVGMGNYKDANMELLADKGNGNYAYIDTLAEAKKVLVEQMGGTLYTIAKDVKIQVQFNPAKVKAYRLVGYENRVMQNEDFDNDKKDAGEIGAGHSVTAVYELIMVDGHTKVSSDGKYVSNQITEQAKNSDEIMTVSLRYKKPAAQKSILLEHVVKEPGRQRQQVSQDFRFIMAVIEYGLLLRQSEYRGKASYDAVIERAQAARGRDRGGYRKEFIQVVKRTKHLSKL